MKEKRKETLKGENTPVLIVEGVLKHLTLCPLLFTFLVIFLSGCGYTTGTIKGAGREDVPAKTIAVHTFTNETLQPRLEHLLTSAIIDRFIADGRLKVVETKTADLVLTGKIVKYELEPVSYDPNGEVREYRARIVVNVTCKNEREGKILWSQDNFEGYDTYANTYLVFGALAETEDDGIAKTIRNLARSIIERTVEVW